MQRTLAHLPFGTDFQKMIVQLALTLCLGAPLPGHWADPAPARRMLRDIGTVEAGADGITVDGKKVEGGTLVIGGLTTGSGANAPDGGALDSAAARLAESSARMKESRARMDESRALIGGKTVEKAAAEIGTVEAGADGITVDGKKVEGGTLVIGGLTIDAPPEPASRVNHAPRSALTPKAEDEFAAGAPLPQQQPKDAPAQKKPWWHFW